MWKNQKDSAEIEAEGLMFHQVKCVWNRKAQGIKGPLCMVGFSSLLFLVSTWWSVLVICTKHCGSCISLCESGLAFVRAVSQLFFLLGSHVGNRRIYLQIDFCKTILFFSPDSFSPPPLPSTIWPFLWRGTLACFFVIHLVVCVSALRDSGRNTGLGAGNLELVPHLRLGTLEKSPEFLLWGLTEV